MAANRVSTSLVRFFGAGIKAQQTNGKFANIVSDGQGNELPMAADVQRFLTQGLVSASVNIEEYQSIRGYLETLGVAPLAAKTMALVFVDAAEAQGVRAMSLVEQTGTNKLKLVGSETYDYINQLRDTTNQLANSAPVDNGKSIRARYLLP